MKRILLAFGDSHTSGAEIDEQYSGECHDKAYPAYIARHYGFDYENLAVCGGSNDWMIKQFMIRIQHALIKKEKVFVLCNFCEASRTYIKLPGRLQHCTSSFLLQNENTKKELLVDPRFIQLYKNYLRTNSDEFLNYKSLSQIFMIQTICDQYSIPYVFHTSTDWYEGNWNLIKKKNYFGHHATNKVTYNKSESYRMFIEYSYWGIAMHHPDWKTLQKDPRWSMHYPESFHQFWAQILINFIDNQKILDTGP
jgi:hypothetical protein